MRANLGKQVAALGQRVTKLGVSYPTTQGILRVMTEQSLVLAWEMRRLTCSGVVMRINEAVLAPLRGWPTGTYKARARLP